MRLDKPKRVIDHINCNYAEACLSHQRIWCEYILFFMRFKRIFKELLTCDIFSSKYSLKV